MTRDVDAAFPPAAGYCRGTRSASWTIRRRRVAGPLRRPPAVSRAVGDRGLLSQPGSRRRRCFATAGSTPATIAYTVEGEIYLTGRVKDLIIRGGRNLYPYELEQAVGNLAGVRRGCVAVFASNDPVNAQRTAGGGRRDARRGCGSEREALRRQIDEAAVDVIGMPADEVVLAPLERGAQDLKRQDPAQRHARCLRARPAGAGLAAALRLGLAAAKAQSAGHGEAGRTRALRRLVLGRLRAAGVPVALVLAALQRPPLGRRIGPSAARLFLRLAAMPVHAQGIRACRAGRTCCWSTTPAISTRSCSTPRCRAAPTPSSPSASWCASRFLHAVLRGLGTLFVERYEAAKSAEDVEEIGRGAGGRAVPGGLSRRHLLARGRPQALPHGRLRRRGAHRRAGGGGRTARQPRILRDKTWQPRHGRPEFEVGAVLRAQGQDWAAAVRLREAVRAEMLRLSGEHDLEVPVQWQSISEASRPP
jgi:hypothetical protein